MFGKFMRLCVCVYIYMYIYVYIYIYIYIRALYPACLYFLPDSLLLFSKMIPRELILNKL